MKAIDARKLAEGYVGSRRIVELYNALGDRIREVAKLGRVGLVHPWKNLAIFVEGSSYVSQQEIEALTLRLRQDGYTVTEHPPADPGHPASVPFTEITW